MMTLDKAIKKYEENSKFTWNGKPTIYAEECLQMVAWLKDYKRLLEQEPCEDAVSRQEAINAAIDGADKWDGGFNREREKCIREEIEKLPPVTPQQKMGSSSEKPNKWIPCSERLPEKNDVYLVAVNSWGCPTRDVDGFMAHTDRKWEVYGNKVIAWMPLPEPYKAEGSDKE